MAGRQRRQGAGASWAQRWPLDETFPTIWLSSLWSENLGSNTASGESWREAVAFKSVPGRRQTQPGRQIIRAHRAELEEAEALVNAQVNAWKAGLVRPTGAALEAMLVRWRDLAVGDELHLNWAVQERRGRRTNRCSGRGIARMEPRR